jgi:PAS domain S-box-containing protein
LLELDLRTVVVLNAVATLLMGLGLLVAVRDYLGTVPGVKRWTTGALLQGAVWSLLTLRGTVPDSVLAGMGSWIIGLVAALYYHALVEFRGLKRPVRWAYGVAGLNAAVALVFVLVVPHAGWRIIFVSVFSGVLLLASGRLLLQDRRQRTASVMLVGTVFLACGGLLLLRAVVFLFLQVPADTLPLAPGLIQNIAFLMFFAAGIVLTFGFLLMCNDRHSAEISRLALVATHTSAPVLLGDHNRNIEWVNPAFTRRTGYTFDEVVGRQPGDFLRRSNDNLAAVERIRAALAQNRGADEEQLFFSKDNTPFWVRNKVDVILDDAGKPLRYISVYTDITERKRAEQEIVRLNGELEQRVASRTAQLENANKELEAFSYSVAHDLRTPLSTIDGFSHLLERNTDPERRAHYLQRIRASVKHMGDLTQALLSLSRITRSVLRWENVDMTAIATGVVDTLRERVTEGPVHVDIQADMKAVGDPHLLAQVMDNLIGNAWKFSARSAAPYIRVGCMDGPEKEAVYFVKDNGVGFDMAHAGKLFGPFERLHTPGDYAGTGIGLATVHRIVRRHGGRVWAESAPGEGASFYFSLGMPPDPKAERKPG